MADIIAQLREQVAAAALNMCECSGECGRKHRQPGARCLALDEPEAPLHAVPREPVPDAVAARLSAADLMALCAGCDRRLATVRARRPADTGPDLFTLGGAA